VGPPDAARRPPEGERPAWDGPAPGAKHFARLDELAGQVGRDLAESGWTTVDQARIDRFAEATGDWQWIHVDAARAAAGPFGATIAHGFLTVSLLPAMRHEALHIDDVRMGINYGLNRVRFPAPVPVGSRVRAKFRLLAFEPLPGGAQLTIQATIERDGSAKPVCVAELVSRHFV
jgi:acyl dehydratase